LCLPGPQIRRRPPPAGPRRDHTGDIAKLKAQLDQQQKQIEQLIAALAAQRTMLEQAGMATPAADQSTAHYARRPADCFHTPMALPRPPGAEPGCLGQPAAGSGRGPAEVVLSAPTQ